MAAEQINLVLAWLWILLGFASGLGLGLFFHRENWLGGYSSLKRRLYRLAHISFFGLGAVNLCFYLTERAVPAAGPNLTLASWLFVLGAVSMPACCLVMAHFPRTRLLFSIPVLSLVAAGMLTLASLIGIH
jgi:hypothetical protein